jgi:nucleoid-associated protein YgaU
MTAKYDTLSRYTIDTNGQSASRGAVRTPAYTVYVCRQGDTLESIATRYLGDPLRYWEIADINPQVKFPLDLAVGKVLRLPT